MTDVSGAMLTTNVLSDQLAIDISDRIKQLEPNIQPLTIFSARAETRKTVATKFSWLEEARKARFDSTTGTATTTITVIPVAHGAYFQQWDLVLNTRTGEMFRVDEVAGNNLTVTRGLQGTPGTGIAMNNADELMLIGSAQPENDTAKQAASDIPVKKTNYTQIWRDPFELSDSLRASAFQVGPAEWPRQMRNKGFEHQKSKELTLLLGRKSLTTPGSAEDRTTGGALSFISSNQTDAGGDLSEAEFNAFMLQVMRYGSQRKLAMASGVGVSALNKFPASKQQTRNDETTYGMDVTNYTSPFGSLALVYHRLLEGTKYGGYTIVVDLDEIAWRPLGNDEMSRDTQIKPNRQAPSQDGRMDEYLTEGGLEFGTERAHGVLTGQTS